MVAFEEILQTIGDFGFFQKLLILGLAFENFLFPVYFGSLLFVEEDPERHCNTDWILRADPNLTTGEQLNLTVPREEDGTFSRCRMFVPVDWDIGAIREKGLNETTGCQSGWVYGKGLYEATIVTDFDLVCDKSNMVYVLQSLLMVGMLFGSFIFGPVAEMFGRKRTTQLPVILIQLFLIVIGVSPNIYVYAVSMFMLGAALGGFTINSIVLATEWTGITKRSFATCLCRMSSGLGQCALAGVFYVITNWRIAHYAMAGAHIVECLYILWIPESARWLLGQGRTEEANKLIRRVAAINKKKIEDNLMDEVTEKQEIEKGRFRDIFTSPVLIKYLFIVSFSWFSLNLGYFCLILNVGKYGLNIFLVQFLFGISETPAHLLCIWVLELIGRKKSLILIILTGSLVCLLTLAFPQDSAIVITALVTTGKFFLNWGGTVCMVYIQELFPTSVRQSAVALGSIAYRVAGFLSPLLNMLVTHHWSIPTITYSSLSLLSGALVFMLPETSNKELPASTKEVEGIRTSNSKKMGSDPDMADNMTSKSTKL